MTWTLLVRSHGRWHYLERCLAAIDDLIGMEFFTRRVLSLDGCQAPSRLEGFEVLTTGPQRLGLAANVGQAWGALAGDEWVLDLEEDFVLLEAPLSEMRLTLEAYPQVCRMTLVRQPWSPEERAAGSMLDGPHFKGQLEDRGGWLEQRQLLSLNPSVFHAASVADLTPGVETELTLQCRRRGWSFGMWGDRDDDPRCLHIGAEGGMGSPGWVA